MVLPSPNKDETKEEFVARFMSNETAKKEFPETKQRSAVAFQRFREANKMANNLQIFQFKSTISKTWEEKVLDKSLGGDVTNERFMETVVSGLAEDRDGDRMSQKAINGMIEQFKSETVPFFPDHGRDEVTGQPRVYSWKQMLGVWIDAKQVDDNLHATVRLNMHHPDQEQFWNYVHFAKMPIGFSIGGVTSEPTEIEIEDEPKLTKGKDEDKEKEN